MGADTIPFLLGGSMQHGSATELRVWLERLTDASIDAVVRAILVLVQRYGKIKPQRTKRRRIADADAHTCPDVGKVRRYIG